MNNPKPSIINDMVNVGRGALMGCADVVPGVSGGTLALIVGIYERLVTAINRFDFVLLGLLRRRQWKQAAEHVDLRFLSTLGGGIGLGVVTMSFSMKSLLEVETTRPFTLAAFFGMILASAVLVTLMIKTRSSVETATCVVLGILGTSIAYWLATLHFDASEGSDPSYGYLFLCGAVAICAMILPGISGAMILLILGVYFDLVAVPSDLLHGENIGGSLLTLLVFGLGCAVGLLSFSKVLRWLLARHQSVTMATLCGFMFGALRKLWPFQEEILPFADKFKYKQFDPILPEAIDSHLFMVAGAALAAMAMVFIIDRCTRGHDKTLLADNAAGATCEEATGNG